jgi:hypothetical protein
MPAALTNGQKAYLAQLARRAWALDAEADSQDADSWRHEQVVKAVGKAGLTCCSQDDYGFVKGHFLNLIGEPGQALKAHVRQVANPRRVAEYKLREACRDFGLSIGYAAAICRRQNEGMGLEEVDEKRIWFLVFTIRNRGRKKVLTGGNRGNGERERMAA